MQLIVVEHLARQRHKYPSSWTVVGPTRVAAIVPDGEYWYEYVKRWPTTVHVKLEDLRTGHIKT